MRFSPSPMRYCESGASERSKAWASIRRPAFFHTPSAGSPISCVGPHGGVSGPRSQSATSSHLVNRRQLTVEHFIERPGGSVGDSLRIWTGCTVGPPGMPSWTVKSPIGFMGRRLPRRPRPSPPGAAARPPHSRRPRALPTVPDKPRADSWNCSSSTTSIPRRSVRRKRGFESRCEDLRGVRASCPEVRFRVCTSTHQRLRQLIHDLEKDQSSPTVDPRVAVYPATANPPVRS